MIYRLEGGIRNHYDRARVLYRNQEDMEINSATENLDKRKKSQKKTKLSIEHHQPHLKLQQANGIYIHTKLLRDIDTIMQDQPK